MLEDLTLATFADREGETLRESLKPHERVGGSRAWPYGIGGWSV